MTILKRRNLKEARLAMTLKQAEIAASIGVSQSTYSKYERGEASPREATWRKLSAILDKPVDHLWQQAD